MTITHHDPIELVAGDDWDIGGTLQRSDGTAFDLTDATVMWMLRDPDGVPVFIEGDYAINLGTPPTAGLLTIVIASAVTASLRPGRYIDWLRATDLAGTDTLWTGIISVDANPWGD